MAFLNSFRRSFFKNELNSRVISSVISFNFTTKRILFLGTPDVAATCLNTFYTISKNTSNNPCNYEIVAVVSQPPALVKRKKLVSSPVHMLGEKLKLPVLTPETAKDIGFIEHLNTLNIDLCITAAYGNYLPKKFLSIPKFGTINIHPSLLPKYRGASPIQRCLENGDSETGVSVLYTVSKMDAGPIVKQIHIPLSGDEKATDLTPKAFALGTQAVVDLLPSIFDGTVFKTEQDDSLATPADKLTKADGLVRFDHLTARQVHNRCRGYAEWPGIYAFFLIGADGTTPSRIKIITTTVIRDAEDSTPSAPREHPHSLLPVKINGVEILSVLCADGSELGISHLQVATRKAMSVRDFLNGMKTDRVVRWVDAPLEEETVTVDE